MIKPVLSSILMASVLFAGAGQALASDRHQSYRDRGTEYHQHDRDARKHQSRGKFERHEFKHRERHPRFAYPHFAGFEDEKGFGVGDGYNINIDVRNVICIH